MSIIPSKPIRSRASVDIATHQNLTHGLVVLPESDVVNGACDASEMISLIHAADSNKERAQSCRAAIRELAQ